MSLFRKRYYISSRDRDANSLSTTNFKVYLTVPIDRKFTQGSVRKVTIPYTIYTINSNNNKLYWVDSDATVITTTITNGNYDQNTLAAAIAAQMNIDKHSANTYTCTVNSTTAKITITNNTSNFQLTTTNTTSAIWDTIGFTTSSDKTGSTSYTGTNVYNLQPTSMFYICSTLSGSNDSLILSGDFPVINSIPVSANFGDIVTYTADTDDTFNINNTNTILQFELRDEKYNIIDLNGLNWSLEIDFS